MFKNDYQGGAYFEIFSAQGKNALANWKLAGGLGIKKVYEKEVKGFVYSLEGSTTTTKMSLPKDSRQSLVLIQHYLIFQSYVKKGQDFTIELGVVDISSNKRRILLSTCQRGVQSTPLHAKVPLNIIKRGMWLNLCIDLVSLVADLWKGQTFKAVDSVCVTATCQLRKIFSMKQPPHETTKENDINQNPQVEFDSIPKHCQFPNDVQQETQMINLKKIEKADKLQNSDSSRESPFPVCQPLEFDQKQKNQIAFGSKVPVVPPRKNSHKRLSSETHNQPTSRKINGSVLPNFKKSLPPTCPSVTPSQSLVYSPNLTNSSYHHNNPRGTKHLAHDVSFKPHPPHEPSSDKNRRRIRVRSAGHELNSEQTLNRASNDLVNSESLVSLHRRTPSNFSEEGPKSQIKKSIEKNEKKKSDSQFHNSKENNETNFPRQTFSKSKDPTMHSKILLRKRPDGQSSENSHSSGFMDVGPDIPEIQSPRKPIEMDDSLSAVIAMLKDGSVVVDCELSDHDNISNAHSEYGDDDSDLEFADQEDDPVYVFTSFPKSAPECSHSPIQDTDTTNGKFKNHLVDPVYSGRGAKPEDDFVSVMNGSDEDGCCPTVMNGVNSSHCIRTHNNNNNSATSSRGSSGKSVSSWMTIPLPEKGSQLPVQSQFNQPQVMEPKSNITPEPNLHHHHKQHLYDSRQYAPLPFVANDYQNSMSKLNRKSLREVSPSNIMKSLVRSAEKPYDSTKYETMDIMGSLEEQMLASMKRQRDEELVLYQKKLSESGWNSVDPNSVDPMMLANHLYDDDSLTTNNSEDDTTFNSLKVPLALRFAHNYKEEMKYPSRRSSDTLSSSNPRDWSNVFSPPIVLASEINQQPLQKVLETFADEDNRMTNSGVQLKNSLNEKNEEEEEEELQLLYDPVLGYYYDPKSRKYYQLI